MRHIAVQLAVAAAISCTACELSLTSPSPNQTQQTSVTVTTPPSAADPTTPTDPTPPGPGVPIPVPTGGSSIATNYAAQYPGRLATSCQATAGPLAWQYIDGLVAALRATDPRWGYVCRHGNCADPSPDVIAYLGSGASPVKGAQGTWGIDVIGNHCGQGPTATWQELGYDAQGAYTPSRF